VDLNRLAVQRSATDHRFVRPAGFGPLAPTRCLMKRHAGPIWFPVLVTPLPVPLALVLVSIPSTGGISTIGSSEDWRFLLIFLVYGMPSAYGAMLTFGLPYVLWLRSRGQLTLSCVCIGGALASVTVVPAYLWLIDPTIPPMLSGVLFFATLGALPGMVFCLAAGRTFRRSRHRADAA
jgi:hypothetical protein